MYKNEDIRYTEACLEILGILLHNGARVISDDNEFGMRSYCMTVYDVHEMYRNALYVPMSSDITSPECLKWVVSATPKMVGESIATYVKNCTEPLPSPSECKYQIFNFVLTPQIVEYDADNKVKKVYAHLTVSGFATDGKVYELAGYYGGWVYEDEDTQVPVPEYESDTQFWYDLYTYLYVTKTYNSKEEAHGY